MIYTTIFIVAFVIGHLCGWADRGSKETQKRIADATTDYKNNPPVDDL